MGLFPALDAGSQTGVVQTALALAELNRMMSPFQGWTSLPHKITLCPCRAGSHACCDLCVAQTSCERFHVISANCIKRNSQNT